MPLHNIEPLFNEDSRILILGSFPSVKSRETKFFYGYPQNRFWKIIATIYGEEVPQTIAAKKELILNNHLALWDVIESCEIEGSSDSSIRNVKVNDIDKILKKSRIEKICVNGKTAEKLYCRYLEKKLDRKAIYLPSSSPANAAYSLDDLVKIWKEVLRTI
ncbi:MAG: DNA-deoxyinosine glycosylase [Erysipelotrichaceae bacterium]|nr:DNA-deoxyinosine glycosylase [Erysipelotrichaceae bacterium]